MTQELITTLLPLAIVVLLRLWNTGTIQASVGKLIPQLPKWAQWIPPMALSVAGTVAVWLTVGVSDATLTDTLIEGTGKGIFTIGLYHFLKRVIPAAALAAIGAAVKRAGPLLVLFALAGLAGLSVVSCSGTLEESRGARIVEIRALGLPLQATDRDEKRCATLSDREDLLATGVQLGTVLTGASGISTWPAKRESTEEVLAITAASVGALTVATEFYRQETASTWARECSE